MSVRSRILAERQKAVAQGQTPTRVFLPWVDETTLEVELSAENPLLQSEIRHQGLRKVLPRLYDLEIVWDSDAFHVG